MKLTLGEAENKRTMVLVPVFMGPGSLLVAIRLLLGFGAINPLVAEANVS